MKSKISFWVVLLGMLSVTMNLAANLVSGRLGFFDGFVAPMGVFFFPFIYIISDVTSDVYGYRISRMIAWCTMLANVLFVGTILLVVYNNTPAPWCIESDNAIKLLLVGTTGVSGMLRVMIAGCIGAVLGGWVNDIIFQIFRHNDGVNKFLKRKLMSSVVAELVDTLTFITLAFYGSEAWGIQMYVIQFILKYGVEVITSPVARICARRLRDAEGDVFEDRNQFNIFGISRS